MADPQRPDRDRADAEDPPGTEHPAHRATSDLVDDPELPIVARLVVEIRSDGSRTITRGALEDAISGETVAIEARADSPLELSLNLAKILMQAPAMASNSLRGTLPTGADLRAHARARLGRLGKRLRQRLRGGDS